MCFPTIARPVDQQIRQPYCAGQVRRVGQAGGGAGPLSLLGFALLSLSPAGQQTNKCGFLESGGILRCTHVLCSGDSKIICQTLGRNRNKSAAGRLACCVAARASGLGFVWAVGLDLRVQSCTLVGLKRGGEEGEARKGRGR